MRSVSMIAALAVVMMGASRCERESEDSPSEGGGNAGASGGDAGASGGHAGAGGGHAGAGAGEAGGGDSSEPSARRCGGIAGLQCPGAGTCVDDPSDDCDPDNGGADCGGLCTCSAAAVTCLAGTPFDDDPNVCACEGGEGGGEPCGPNDCAEGEVCCNESCGICTEPGGVCTQQFCEPDPGPEPDPNAPSCAGIGGFDCPGAGFCVDDPSDDCDPENGGADCGGLCSCSAAAVLCVTGTVFNDDPNVCACEPAKGEGEPCGPTTCAEGQVCCNESCGICTEPDGFCTEQFCEPEPDPDAPSCGGFAGFQCPGEGECVDDPSDDCDPEHGGADCGGLCECNVGPLIDCVPDRIFDDSPAVCACVEP